MVYNDFIKKDKENRTKKNAANFQDRMLLLNGMITNNVHTESVMCGTCRNGQHKDILKVPFCLFR
jgi:hypothetical protein